jgi:uncharacterized membrane protein
MATSAPAVASAAYEPGAQSVSTAPARIESIDFARGVVMILMAIDHVRVFAGVPAGGDTPGLFFTRWITHFVAPGFVLLAGTAAYLHGLTLPGRAALARFLLTRGAWLVLLELTVIRLSWTFNFDFANYNLAGVIWMLGVCMMLMAGLVYLPVRVLGVAGVAIVALHNVTDIFSERIWRSFGEAGPGWLLKFLYFGGAVQVGSESGPPLLILYVIVPWIGVMMAGYALGAFMQQPPEQRRALLLRIGAAMTVAFVALRALDAYGDPGQWTESNLPRGLAFLATTKYPASLLFLLMTLGPVLMLMGLAERWRRRGPALRAVTVFGRVPMFYYLLHIPVIHLAAMVVSLAREGRVNPWLFGNHPLAPPDVPDGYAWSLPLLYMVFVLCVAVLYVPCRWYARVRAERRSRWLSYL